MRKVAQRGVVVPELDPANSERKVKRETRQSSKRPTVFLGMSGGVDSSLSAVLLKEQGYRVVGVYMKNWSRDLPGMKCPWAEDLADAKRVAVQLGIDFRVFDFEAEYKQKVVDYMLAEFKSGRTPNPDIMCNQEVKFKLFYEVAREQGADLIATGHYAQVEDGQLLKAVDASKDQTYFLYRISEEALAHTLFPIGHLTKPEVKRLAAEKGLKNAYKKESMGVCFVGEVGMKDFLQEYFPKTPGKILDIDTGEQVGMHEGAVFYTIGQRSGLNLGGGLPYYIVKKDMATNTLFVSRNLNSDDLWTTELELEDVILRGGDPNKTVRVTQWGRKLRQDQNTRATSHREPITLEVRLRHRAPLIPAQLKNNKLTFEKPIKRPASGQSAVFYSDDICLGGGIIH